MPRRESAAAAAAADAKFAWKAGIVFLVGFAILAAPGFLEIRRRAKERTTLTRIREVGDVLERTWPDTYPCIASARDLPAGVTAAIGAEKLLDGWGHPLVVRAGTTRYVVMSLGSDGRRDADDARHSYIGYAGDTIYSNGDLILYPAGIATAASMPPEVADVLAEAADCRPQDPRRGCEYYLYFPSERGARGAAADVTRRGFTPEVRRSASGGKWLCVVRRNLENCLDAMFALERIEKERQFD